MRVTKLNGRFNAKKQWGYNYSVTFNGFDWKRFYAFKSQTKEMLGESIEMKKSYMWREDMEHLRTAPWAYHYWKSSKPMIVYFRDENDLTQVMTMFVLTGKDTQY